MCLTGKIKKYEEPLGGRARVGYKVLYRVGRNVWEPPFYGNGTASTGFKTLVFKKGKWLTDPNQNQLVVPSANGLRVLGSYPAGFHVLLSRKDAETYNLLELGGDGVVVKVRYKGVVAEGHQGMVDDPQGTRMKPKIVKVPSVVARSVMVVGPAVRRRRATK